MGALSVAEEEPVLYRVRPDAPLEWCDFPGFSTFRTAVESGADFDRLGWQLTEARAMSADLLRIALRHGVRTTSGIVVSAEHTTELGRGDELRAYSMASSEAQAELRATHGELLEHLLPGSTEYGEELDRRVRESTERVAREADDELAAVLAAPVQPALASHWQRLGGTLPD